MIETAFAATDDQIFDVFLSHAVADAAAIAGVKVLLEDQGHTVYVDWIVDAQLDRDRVTPASADLSRKRLRQSKSLFFATSTSSPDWKWMPWELGYFDGFRQGGIAILPLVAVANAHFSRQEYLGLYPVAERLLTTVGDERLYQDVHYAWRFLRRRHDIQDFLISWRC